MYNVIQNLAQSHLYETATTALAIVGALSSIGISIVTSWLYKIKNQSEKKQDMICTPKVRRFWRCIFLWVKQEEKTKSIVQNLKSVL